MRKTGLWLLVLALGLGLASFPAYKMASKDNARDVIRTTAQAENIQVFPSSIDTFGGPQDAWDWSWDVRESTFVYTVNCGSVLKPLDPPSVTEAGQTDVVTHADSRDLRAAGQGDNRLGPGDGVYSAQDAVAVLEQRGTPASWEPPSPQENAAACKDDRFVDAVWAFLASPPGWVVIGVVGLLALGMVAGGGGGGGTWSGTATPNLTGTGFNVRLRR